MTTVEDLTPAALTPESLARVHALWSWTYRVEVVQVQAALRGLSTRELRDVRLAADMLGSYVVVELLKRVDNDEPRIDRKELAILCERGRQRFEALRNRPPEHDNDWWLAWGDDEISFCFLVEMERETPNLTPAGRAFLEGNGAP